jgi:hypothetical protein
MDIGGSSHIFDDVLLESFVVTNRMEVDIERECEKHCFMPGDRRTRFCLL